jgi:hypothetical protein
MYLYIYIEREIFVTFSIMRDTYKYIYEWMMWISNILTMSNICLN